MPIDELLKSLRPLIAPWMTPLLDWASTLPDWMKDSKTIEIAVVLVVMFQLGRIVRELRRQRTEFEQTREGFRDMLDGFKGTLKDFDGRLRSLRNAFDEQIRTLGERFGDQILPLRNLVQALSDETASLVEAARGMTETVNELEADAEVGLEYWEKVRSLWATTRNRIESKIDGIKDGRVRRKYANMDRYSYSDIITTLLTDKELNSVPAAKLMEMSGTFNKRRSNPKSTTKQDAELFESLYKAVSGSLPPVEGAAEPRSTREEKARVSESTGGEKTQPSASILPELVLEIPTAPQ